MISNIVEISMIEFSHICYSVQTSGDSLLWGFYKADIISTEVIGRKKEFT